MRWLSLLLVATFLSVASPVDARCAPGGLVYERVGEGDVSASAPAFLVGVAIAMHGHGVEALPAPAHLSGTPARALTATVLAPGLVRLSSSAPVPAGSYAVEGFVRRVSVRVRRSLASASVMPAPQLVSLTTGIGRGGPSETTAVLGAPPPPSAVAVIVSRGGTPIAWSPVLEAATTMVVGGNLRCIPEPVGHAIPTAGESATLQWVDVTGALSPASSAVVVH